MKKPQFILYARKSTDDEDHQIMSIEAQLFELREYAKREGLEIIEEITENKTAKKPGREKFAAMVAKIEKSNGIGILAWHPDRLARNSIDGGRIIYLVDTGKIAALRFPTFWFETTPQGKFMLSIAFGQSKYYIDNLSENVKRGLRQKVRRGDAPIKAPLGYFNDLRSKTIEPDRKTFKKMKSVFDDFATGEYSLSRIQDKMFSLGFVGKTGKALRLSTIQWILKNPFYYGMFVYHGELFQGNHKPMLSKKLFDQVQKVIADNGKPRKEKITKDFAFRHFAVCGECGYSIIAELKTKESGRKYVYYRCSHKCTKQHCGQRYYLPESELAEQIKDYVQKVSLTDTERDTGLSIIAEWENENRQPAESLDRDLKAELSAVKAKISRLSDAYLEEAFEIDEYKEKKNILVNQKRDIEEKMADFHANGNRWLELSKNLILDANKAGNIASGGNFAEMRNFLKKHGSNRKILNRRLVLEFNPPWNLIANRGVIG
jgi:DNA invertase Pin-like site-specific DNA recombinase